VSRAVTIDVAQRRIDVTITPDVSAGVAADVTSVPADIGIDAPPGARSEFELLINPPVWVHPDSGSDTNDGLTPDTPFETIQQALLGNYRVLHVAAGTHTVSSIDAPATFIMYPGWHYFANTPVTSTIPFNMVAASIRMPSTRYSTVGAAVINGAAATDIFQISDGSTDLYGGAFIGLRWNRPPISRSHIYTSNVSGMVLKHNSSAWLADYYEKFFVWATGTSGHEIRDWYLDNNHISRMNYVRITGAATFHDWVYQHAIGGGGGQENMTIPWIHADAACYGFKQSGNSWEFGAGANPVWDDAEAGYWYEDILQQSRIYTMMCEGMFHNEGNRIVRADDARSSYFNMGRGDWASNGELNVNGVQYDGDYDTIDSKYNRIVVQSRAEFD
jgi:hypothetical protein